MNLEEQLNSEEEYSAERGRGGKKTCTKNRGGGGKVRTIKGGEVLAGMCNTLISKVDVCYLNDFLSAPACRL